MSTPIAPRLILDGDDFLPGSGYSATVETAIGGVSTFSVSFPANATETYSGALMDNSVAHIGREMSIELGDGAMQFTGLIASVDLAKGTGASGTIVLSGQGPSMLLASSLACRSHEQGATLSQVARDTLKGHSGDILEVAMGEGAGNDLPYTVQYNESDLAFLQRLCRRYGLWFYHDGTRLRIGRGGGRAVKGTYGTDVTDFSVRAALAPKGPGMAARDWEGGNLLETAAGRHGASSTHHYFGPAAGGSDGVFHKKGLIDYTVGRHGYDRQGGMDHAARAMAHGGAAGMVTATGSSRLVSLNVGDTLSLEGRALSGGSGADTLGDYDIIAVSHRFDNSGGYANSFRAVPGGTVHPPYSDALEVPFAPDQRGRVVDNADPEGMGRVQVQFEWQREISRRTPWIKTTTPYGGAGKGFHFIPETGEEVLVGFEGGNPEKPYVIGGAFGHEEKSGFADADNNIKAIRTRSGHTIELNDTNNAESITITDKKNNIITIDTANNNIMISSNNDISVSAAENMMLNSKNMQINVEENLDITVGKNKTESIADDHTLMANNLEQQIGENIKVISSTFKQDAQEITIDTSGEIKTNAGGKITIASSESVDYGQ